MIKVLELFAGIGAFSSALDRLEIEHQIIDAVEIDKYAMESFNAIHGTNFEPQDITKWNKDIDVDIIMHGSPCQDFSVAGKQAGGDEGSGTRSSLMYETIRIVEKLKPKYVIWENVKNVLSKKHRHNFNNYLGKMEELGYRNYYQVLNAKDYGIPQNRERVFTISILGNQEFQFPSKQELKLRLKDMLEDEVDEKYYLSGKMLNYITANNDKWTGNNDKSLINKTVASTINTGEGSRRCDASNYVCNSDKENIDIKQVAQIYGTQKEPNPQDGRVYDNNGLSPTLDSTHQPKMLIKNNTKQGYLIAQEGDGVYTNTSNKRGTVQKQMIPTLTSFQDKGVVVIGNYSPSNHEASRVVDNNGIAPTVKENHGTVTATQEKALYKTKNKRLKSLVKKTNFEEGKVLNMDLYNQKTNENISQCLTEPHHNSQALYDGLRIRKLTPKECWRLMGFTDEEFEKAQTIPTSNSQLYKQAGNSIVVNVLVEILKQLFIENSNTKYDAVYNKTLSCYQYCLF